MHLKKLNLLLTLCLSSLIILSCTQSGSNNTLDLSTLTTAAVSSITQTNALSGGNISDDGGNAVTARGVCWNTSPNPTVANNKTTDGNGTGAFASTLTGLLPNTIYYVRAYATNSEGTAYGNEVSFQTQGAVATKLKRYTGSYGVKQADIFSFDYDAQGRLLNFTGLTNDSTYNPVKLVSARYYNFVYNGSSELPARSIITYNNVPDVDSTVYSYDAQNRVIAENWYRYGQSVERSNYTYVSTGKVIRELYQRINNNMIIQSRDSMTYDQDNKLIEMRNTMSNYTNVDSYTYDNNKINPLASINAFKYIYSLSGDDRIGYYRSPANMTGHVNTSGTTITTIQVTYAYNSNGTPAGGTSVITKNSSSETHSFKYEYY